MRKLTYFATQTDIDLYHNLFTSRFNNTLAKQVIPIIVTLVLEEDVDNHEGLIEDVRTEIEGLESKLLINITVTEVNRFGKNSTLVGWIRKDLY